MYDYRGERKKRANYMVQFVPEEELFNAHDICLHYGIQSSTGSEHTSFVDHIMINYMIANKFSIMADVQWAPTSQQRDFYYRQEDVEIVLKKMYLGNECKRKGRIEIPTASIPAQFGQEYIFYSGKASVFKLVDTEKHNWLIWGEPVKRGQK
jgi:hypothetical protein